MWWLLQGRKNVRGSSHLWLCDLVQSRSTYAQKLLLLDSLGWKRSQKKNLQDPHLAQELFFQQLPERGDDLTG